MCKVFLNDELYFEVTEHSFDLYHTKKGRKTDVSLGYFTSIEVLLKKATQYALSTYHVNLSMDDFISKWKEIHENFASILRDNKVL